MTTEGRVYSNPNAQASDGMLWGIRQYMHQLIKTRWIDEGGNVIRWAISYEQAGALLDWLTSIHQNYGELTMSRKGTTYHKLVRGTPNGDEGLRIIAEYAEGLLQVFPALRPEAKTPQKVVNTVVATVTVAPPVFGVGQASTVEPQHKASPVKVTKGQALKARKAQAPKPVINTSMAEAKRRQLVANPSGNIPIGKPTTPAPAPNYLMIQ